MQVLDFYQLHSSSWFLLETQLCMKDALVGFSFKNEEQMSSRTLFSFWLFQQLSLSSIVIEMRAPDEVGLLT